MANTVDQLKKILKDGAATHSLLLIGGDSEATTKSITEFLKELEGSASISTRTTEPSARKSSTAPIGAVGNTSLALGRENNKAPLIDAEFIEDRDSESLGIDAVRRLREFLSKKPVKCSKKTAVIVAGDTLTQEAQNALLKICEDPPPNSQIILMVKNEENLLPTLRSRFQKVWLSNGAITKKDSVRIPKEVRELANRFLKSDARARNEIIKIVTGKGVEKGSSRTNSGPLRRSVSEASAAKDDMTLMFLDALIDELRGEPVRHASFLAAILKQKALISSLSLNRRLQLAFLSSLWYNR